MHWIMRGWSQVRKFGEENGKQQHWTAVIHRWSHLDSLVKKAGECLEGRNNDRMDNLLREAIEMIGLE